MEAVSRDYKTALLSRLEAGLHETRTALAAAEIELQGAKRAEDFALELAGGKNQ